MESITRNFHILGNIFDRSPLTTEIIQQNREILSQAHLNSIYTKYPNNQDISNNNNLHERKFKKEKQIKIKWTKEEQILFLEGIEKFGMKSKIIILIIYLLINRFKTSE